MSSRNAQPTAVIAEETGTGDSQSMLCARERPGHMQVAREYLKKLKA